MTALAPNDVPLGQTWPSLAQFHELAFHRRVIPVVRRLLADESTPVGLYRALAAGRPGTFLMESAEPGGAWSRYSFIGVSAMATLTEHGGKAQWTGEIPVGVPTSGDVLDVLDTTLRVLRTPPIAGLPPLTGGLVGCLGWDVLQHWEPTVATGAPQDAGLPHVALCVVADMVVVDHYQGTIWLVANAVNVDGGPHGVGDAHAKAVRRLDAMAHLLGGMAGQATVLADEGPELPVEYSSSREEFEDAVRMGKQAIMDGDVFQVVLSQRMQLPCPAPALDVYRALRTINPSPYMYYMELTGPHGRRFAVVGSSPETLVKVDGGRVTTYPIAGSRPRGADPATDEALAEELIADPKERAEHVMLVDLARNDLSKVCVPGTVEVREFMHTRRFSHIMHLCSTVEGKLRDSTRAFDVFRAAFPAGTLSGAPKPRAVAFINAVEPAGRGIYGGTVGYFDFHGNMDMAIAIRTAVIHDGRASVQAGAGIVADSVPAAEYAESCTKAQAVVRAINLAARMRVLP